jgi:hypothetical protein
MAALRKAIALGAFSSGLIWLKATRDASSTQTWTNSQPVPPRLELRQVLWPVRSPVMRWPTRSKRPSFLMVDVDQLAGMVTLAAAGRRRWIQGLELAQAETLENTADRCGGDTNLRGDMFAGPALPAQDLDASDDLRRRWTVQAPGSRAAVLKTGHTLGLIPRNPLAHRARADACGS